MGNFQGELFLSIDIPFPLVLISQTLWFIEMHVQNSALQFSFSHLIKACSARGN